MSIAADARPATFGAGGAEPYAHALRTGTSRTLYLQETVDGVSARRSPMDFARWNALADDVDFTLLADVTGPVIDIGCGPGRMVRAAMDLGLAVLGIDVSPVAVQLGRAIGLNIIEGSVFDRVPNEGRWQTALLVDGNIGIGGDPAALLARCRRLLASGGELVVEVHDDPERDYTYTGTLVDETGAESASFPWAEIGLTRLVELAADNGLRLRQRWELDGRTFARLVR